MAPQSKIITVSYGIFNNPDQRGIEKAINKWSKKGYTLAHRQDDKPGCLTMLLTAGWARGRTQLTFVRKQ